MKLSNKVAIVTGSRRGIGRAIAIALGREGANVVVTDINLEDCQKVANEIKQFGVKTLAIKCDVSSKTDVDKMINTVVKEWGRIDILINNAGVLNFKPFLELTEEEWDRIIDINLKGYFLCGQAAAREMLKNKWGRVINIASISAGGCGIAFPQIAHYTASKGGVIGLTEAMAIELTPLGINVNAISPGSISTDIAGGQQESEQSQRLLLRIPKGRIGRPEDVAELAVFLASEASDYISGDNIMIDGGWMTT